MVDSKSHAHSTIVVFILVPIRSTILSVSSLEKILILVDYLPFIKSWLFASPFFPLDAAHVTMATDKFLRRIVAPDIEAKDGSMIASELHNYTHGINSDPLTILAIIFSALIHDVDHRGVSNARLAEEEKDMASLYQNKSIAEQNSLDIAWDLLMENKFDDLRGCLFADKSELGRFRQILVNGKLHVMNDKLTFVYLRLLTTRGSNCNAILQLSWRRISLMLNWTDFVKSAGGKLSPPNALSLRKKAMTWEPLLLLNISSKRRTSHILCSTGMCTVRYVQFLFRPYLFFVLCVMQL